VDFSLGIYDRLMETFVKNGYQFQTFAEFVQKPIARVLLVRHDADRLPENALKMSKIEAGMGVKASYYFRSVPESFDREIILTIADMGHEIGYHY